VWAGAHSERSAGDRDSTASESRSTAGPGSDRGCSESWPGPGVTAQVDTAASLSARRAGPGRTGTRSTQLTASESADRVGGTGVCRGRLGLSGVGRPPVPTLVARARAVAPVAGEHRGVGESA
jgi:hypothetical protein